jgi:hypothetical protein
MSTYLKKNISLLLLSIVMIFISILFLFLLDTKFKFNELLNFQDVFVKHIWEDKSNLNFIIKFLKSISLLFLAIGFILPLLYLLTHTNLSNQIIEKITTRVIGFTDSISLGNELKKKDLYKVWKGISLGVGYTTMIVITVVIIIEVNIYSNNSLELMNKISTQVRIETNSLRKELNSLSSIVNTNATNFISSNERLNKKLIESISTIDSTINMFNENPVLKIDNKVVENISHTLETVNNSILVIDKNFTNYTRNEENTNKNIINHHKKITDNSDSQNILSSEINKLNEAEFKRTVSNSEKNIFKKIGDFFCGSDDTKYLEEYDSLKATQK